MIISHKHKFIFIKPQKTAGTSVELMLSRICGPEDIITPLGFDPDPDVRKKNKAKAPQNYYRPKPLKHWQLNELYWFLTKGRKPNLNYWEHLPADRIYEYVGEDTWNTYLKISVVRNPWDHAVSMYKWMSHYNYENSKELDFKAFITHVYKPMWPFFTIKNRYQIDFMIKFEELQNSLTKLSAQLPIDHTSVPVTKTNTRHKNDHYSHHYTPFTEAMIAEINKPIIERFDYSF